MHTSSVENAAAGHIVQPAADAIRLRRLLCPVDLSETSAASLDTAAELARACGAEITALFVLPAVRSCSAGASPAPPQLPPDPGVRTTVAADLKEFVRGARAFATVNARIEVGDPAAEVLAAAQDTKADAIVMGTHGRSGIECWLLGSVAQKVLRGAQCPVMTVSSRREGPAAAGAARPVLCAVDLAERTTLPLKYALHLGRITGRPVCVVHVLEDPWQYDAAAHVARLDWDGLRRQFRDDASARLEQRIRAECEKGESVERLVLAGKPYREVLQLAEERDASMIVVGRQGVAGARAALFGSTAEHLMRGAKCPVLTVRTA